MATLRTHLRDLTYVSFVTGGDNVLKQGHGGICGGHQVTLSSVACLNLRWSRYTMLMYVDADVLSQAFLRI